MFYNSRLLDIWFMSDYLLVLLIICRPQTIGQHTNPNDKTGFSPGEEGLHLFHIKSRNTVYGEM